jgi:POT family proton-dependent oligopeptide transporter
MNMIAIIGIVVTLLTAIPVVLQLRQHPRGLFILFFAEMWERFSFYGMRALLIFYLTQHFLYDDKYANGQVGAYQALVYVLPVLGGFLADHYLGTRKAVAFGALLLVAGHATMAIEGLPATQILTYQNQEYIFNVEGRSAARQVRLVVGDGRYEVGANKEGDLVIKDLPAGAPLPSVLPKGTFELTVRDRDPLFEGIFNFALSLIAMGVGFLKPNISALVGQLYPRTDPRRDSGFTLFYYGINLGSFWAAITCGWLGQNVGWWAGFGLAGIGMLAGYLVFVWGKPLLEGHGEPPDPARLAKPVFGPIRFEWMLYLGAMLVLPIVWFLVQRFAIVGYALGTVSVIVLGYVGMYMMREGSRGENSRLLLALSLIATSTVFWTLFNQANSSLKQFAERSSELEFLGVSFTAAQTASINSGFILLLAPLFAALWAYLEPRHLDPNAPAKFGLGLVQVALGFVVLVWGAENFADEHYRVPMIFLIGAYLLHTTGELCLSPVGLSQMTKLSPRALIGTVMATWFLASGWAGFLAALIAQLTATPTVAGQVLDPAAALEKYISVFGSVAMWGVGLGIAVLIASPFLGRLDRPASEREAKPAPAAGE